MHSKQNEKVGGPESGKSLRTGSPSNKKVLVLGSGDFKHDRGADIK